MAQMIKYLVFVVGTMSMNGGSHAGESRIEQELMELVEMVPFEKVMALGMEYAISDTQVRSLLGYLSGSKFKENMAALERSEQFNQLADVAEMLYHIDAYSLANKVNRVLDMPLVDDSKVTHRRYPRDRRSPGEGVMGLIKEAVALIPLEEMKEVYQYDIEHNPQFKELMDRLLSGEARVYLDPLLESRPFQETRKDLQGLGLPLKDIQTFLEQTTVEFFDLSSKPPPNLHPAKDS